VGPGSAGKVCGQVGGYGSDGNAQDIVKKGKPADLPFP